MNKTQNDKYSNIAFDSHTVEMLAELIMADEITLKVFNLLLNNTYLPQKNKNVSGITKTEIQSIITVNSLKKISTQSTDDVKFVQAEVPLSRKNCDDAMNFLCGGTLVFYTEGSATRKKYQLTRRGVQIAANLTTKGVTKLQPK